MQIPNKNYTKYVYVIWYEDKQLSKIGISYDPFKRCKDIDKNIVGKHSPLTLVCVLKSNSPDTLEKLLHAYFSVHREKGEWFRLRPDYIMTEIQNFSMPISIIEKNNFDMLRHDIYKEKAEHEYEIEKYLSNMVVL